MTCSCIFVVSSLLRRGVRTGDYVCMFLANYNKLRCREDVCMYLPLYRYNIAI